MPRITIQDEGRTVEVAENANLKEALVAAKASPHGAAGSCSPSGARRSSSAMRAAVSGMNGAVSCAVARSASTRLCRIVPTRGRASGSFAKVNGAVSTMYLLAPAERRTLPVHHFWPYPMNFFSNVTPTSGSLMMVLNFPLAR